MKRNILITETQLAKIKFFILENEVYANNIKIILKDLVHNYEPVVDAKYNGIEYFDQLNINKKVDNKRISPKDLLDYFIYAYPNYNPEFIKTVISDWYFDKLTDDLTLSKNVPIFKN